jgi:hypothetical protein
LNKKGEVTTWKFSFLTSHKASSWWSRWFTTNRRLNITYSTSNKSLFRLMAPNEFGR